MGLQVDRLEKKAKISLSAKMVVVSILAVKTKSVRKPAIQSVFLPLAGVDLLNEGTFFLEWFSVL
jgi:hypothetical protein